MPLTRSTRAASDEGDGLAVAISLWARQAGFGKAEDRGAGLEVILLGMSNLLILCAGCAEPRQEVMYRRQCDPAVVLQLMIRFAPLPFQGVSRYDPCSEGGAAARKRLCGSKEQG